MFPSKQKQVSGFSVRENAKVVTLYLLISDSHLTVTRRTGTANEASDLSCMVVLVWIYTIQFQGTYCITEGTSLLSV